MPRIEDGNFGGEILGLEDDRRREVGEGPVVRHFPLGLHGLGGFAEEGLVALAADEGEGVVAAGLLVNDLGKFLLGGGEFVTRRDALGFQKALLDEFGPAGLNGEIGLGEGDFLLSGIAVLGDEVAGIAGEHEIVNLTLAAGAEINHFVDVNKMVLDGMTRDFTGGLGLGNGGVEVAPLIVTEQVLQVTGEPVFDATLGLLGAGFEGAGECLDKFGVHRFMRATGLWQR